MVVACKAYGKVIEVSNASELLKLKIGERILEDIFSKLPASAFDIY